jgi:pilus assembly protein CpaF
MVIQVNRFSDGARRVTSIAEITGMEQDVITMQEVFVFEKTGVNESGKVMGHFRATGIRPKCSEKLITAGYKLPTDMFEHVHAVNMPHDRERERVRSFR